MQLTWNGHNIPQLLPFECTYDNACRQRAVITHCCEYAHGYQDRFWKGNKQTVKQVFNPADKLNGLEHLTVQLCIVVEPRLMVKTQNNVRRVLQ